MSLATDIEQVLASTLVPSLDERGFERTGHIWRRETDQAVRIVDVQTQEGHGPRSAKFTINLGFSYPSLGDPTPEPLAIAGACRYLHRIGQLLSEPRDTWWEIPDPANASAVQRVTEAVSEAWAAHGLPALDAWSDPQAMRDRLAASGGFDLLDAADMSLHLGERDTAQRCLRTFLDALQTDAHLKVLGPRQPPSTANLARFYLAAIPLLAAAEMSLTPADLARAKEATSAAIGTSQFKTAGEELSAQLEGLNVTVNTDAATPLPSAPTPSHSGSVESVVLRMMKSRIKALGDRVAQLELQVRDLAEAVARGDTAQAESVRAALDAQREQIAAVRAVLSDESWE